MTSPARTPHEACADAGTQFDDALRAIGIKTDPSTVKVTEWEGGIRLHRVAPPQLTPSQTVVVARHLKAVRQ
ncbi:hypothetical protein O1L44_33120 [Streptomyces noursei]|uniref:hypothetical protein n=1 Tax=Streptomyces noursei TaxID=1971 RepID=UPI00081C7E54|nr:hypothetical protein SNOUR_33740 [Streptomyces noursei ATCC 11455]MCZ0996345.1 hypothetical protein [Streptomyces noursei]MCZ0996845.1 hypothetical protein [Streptomyces noursei]